MTFFPVILLFLPVFVSLFIFLIPWRKILYLAFLNQLVLLILVFLLWQYLQTSSEPIYLIFGPYDERFVISFLVDKNAIIFIGLSVLLFTVIMIYAFPSMKNESKFYFFLLFLEAVFIGLLSTNDLFNLFVFLELTTLLVTILIVYKKNESAFKAGLHYLLISSLAAMLFLIGVMFVYYTFGTLNIRIIKQEMSEVLLAQPAIQFAYTLMMSGIFVKAAFFPVYSWLPKAHGVATSSVSALLSGLIIKGAIFMLIKIHFELFHAPYGFNEVIFWIGALSALMGVIFAMSQKDLKQVLAFHTISQLGLLVIGLMDGHENSYLGGMLHILNHAFFKGLLFLVAGLIIEQYQTKKINEIKGLWKTMPWVSIFLIIGILGITGAPGMNGFVSKSLIKYGFKENFWIMVLFQMVNLGTLISFTKLLWMLPGKKQATYKLTGWALIAMGILASMILFVGLFPSLVGNLLFNNPFSSITLFTFENIFDYAMYATLAWFLYFYLIKPDGVLLRWLRSLQPKFNTSIFLLLVLMTFIGSLVLLM